MLTLAVTPVVEVPQLGPLVLRIPLPEVVAERVHPLLRPRLLLVAAAAAEHRVEAVLGDRVEEGDGLQAVPRRARPGLLDHPPGVDRLLHRRHDQLDAELGDPPVAVVEHLVEVVAGVDVHHRERDRAPARTPSRPGAASPRSPCRPRTAARASRTPPRPHGRCGSTRTRGRRGARAGSSRRQILLDRSGFNRVGRQATAPARGRRPGPERLVARAPVVDHRGVGDEVVQARVLPAHEDPAHADERQHDEHQRRARPRAGERSGSPRSVTTRRPMTLAPSVRPDPDHAIASTDDDQERERRRR